MQSGGTREGKAWPAWVRLNRPQKLLVCAAPTTARPAPTNPFRSPCSPQACYLHPHLQLAEQQQQVSAGLALLDVHVQQRLGGQLARVAAARQHRGGAGGSLSKRLA